MNKIRSNLSSKSTTSSKPEILQNALLPASKKKDSSITSLNRKKRVALVNISNATTTAKDTSKKTRFSNPVFNMIRKDSKSLKDKSLSSKGKENKLSDTSCLSKISGYELETYETMEKLLENDCKSKAREITGWEDIDIGDLKNEFNSADYVNYIFKYYRDRENKFIIDDYLKNQPTLNKQMRHLLIDWMVEVQQQLEFNHEVLYLSVKLLDLYLNLKKVDKEKLQLVGGAAMFIACKYEERIPPSIEDFIFVSDNAYTRNELVKMEIDILKTVRFDLGVPLCYTFLRRYAKCVHADMKFLTLARYILELALQEYSLSMVSDSIKACAALYLALKITELNDKKTNTKSNISSTEWNPTLIHYTETFIEDFYQYVPLMNNLIKQAPTAKYKTIFKKYSHQVFYEVAKIPALEDADLETIPMEA